MSNSQFLRAPLAKVRGLGSAKHGTAHWWSMKLTSLALIGLCGWFIGKLVVCLHDGDYALTREWLRSPVSATLMALFLVTGLHHAAAGLQTVLEDYVHCEKLRLASVIVVKAAAILLAGIGLIALGKIAFGS
jgi:succinate dehydrogenase / fumarate reductase, membrane anchor subunit